MNRPLINATSNSSRCASRRHAHRATSISLIAALSLNPTVLNNAFAVQGGGTTPIGTPGGKSQVFDTPAPYTVNRKIPTYGPRRASADINAPASFDFPFNEMFADHDEAYSNDSGVFWAWALKINNQPPDVLLRDGMVATSKWLQRFRKDSDTAWMTFIVSKAYLKLLPNLYLTPTPGGDQPGSHAAVFGFGVLYSQSGPSLQLINETVMLLHRDSSGFNYSEGGPFTCVPTLNNSTRTSEVACDPYPGVVDLSQVNVGESFTVSFDAVTTAEASPGEGPVLAEAYFRDPINTGGGITTETDGLTPLNNPVVTPISSDRTHAQAIQTDGKVVAAGYAYNGTDYDFAVARHNTDGSLDTSFGSGDKVTISFGSGLGIGYAVAIDSQSRIIVAGSMDKGTDNDFAQARVDSSGKLDPAFGVGGKVTTDFSGAAPAHAPTPIAKGAPKLMKRGG
jgi:uncharacterized delta-60 repeat protein